MLKVRADPHSAGGAGGGHGGGVGGGVEVPCDEHHVVADVVLQLIRVRERQVEHVVWKRGEGMFVTTYSNRMSANT